MTIPNVRDIIVLTGHAPAGQDHCDAQRGGAVTREGNEEMTSKSIKRMADIERGAGRYTKARLFEGLSYILSCAEDEGNEDVCFITEDIGHGPMRRGVEVRSIRALGGMVSKLGTDYDPVPLLRGMQALTQDPVDGYCMSVLTTHDLDSASIWNLSELMFRLRCAA